MKIYPVALILMFYSQILIAQVDTLIYSPPSFPGGKKLFFKYIDKKISYPHVELESNIKGDVTANIYVNSSGKVDSILYEGTNDNFINQVKKVFSNMPDWEPGNLNGIAIDTTFRQEFYFSINKYRARNHTHIYEYILFSSFNCDYIEDLPQPGSNKDLTIAMCLYNRGVEELKLSNFKIAVDIFMQAERFNLKSADLYFNRAIAHLKSGNLDAACIDFKLAADLGDSEAKKIIKKQCIN